MRVYAVSYYVNFVLFASRTLNVKNKGVVSWQRGSNKMPTGQKLKYREKQQQVVYQNARKRAGEKTRKQKTT